MSAPVKKPKQKNPRMPDGSCRCCHDRRASTNAEGKPTGRAKTKCVRLDSCIKKEHTELMLPEMLPGQPPLNSSLLVPSEGASAPAMSPAASASPAAEHATRTRSSTLHASQCGSAAIAEATNQHALDAAGGSASRVSTESEFRAELMTAKAELEQLKAKAAAEAEATAAKAAAAQSAAEMAARVTAALESSIQSNIDAAAEHNSSFAIAQPLVGAAIRAAMLHTREVAVARHANKWSPSKNFCEIRLPNPVGAVPCVDEYMTAGAVVKIVDWREFEPDILFRCTKCDEPMEVARHQPEPDGVRRDALSCTVSGRLGLTKEEGAAKRSVITSVQLRCSKKGCYHAESMHSPTIMSQLPGNLIEHYWAGPQYATGMQMHFSRELTDLAEALSSESPTSLANVVAAHDERLALGFERAMRQYHLARRQYLEGLDEAEREAEAAKLPCLNKSMRKRLYGVAASECALAQRIEAKRCADAAVVRVDELRSLEPTPGGLWLLCSDDNEALAQAVQADSYAQPPAKRQREADLPGITEGMKTYGKGRLHQITLDLSHLNGIKSLCTCAAKGKSAKHHVSCEQGIILAAKKAAGYDNRGKKKPEPSS